MNLSCLNAAQEANRRDVKLQAPNRQLHSATMSPVCGREKDLKDSQKALLGLPRTPPPPAQPAPAAPKRAEQPPTPPLGPPLMQVPQRM